MHVRAVIDSAQYEMPLLKMVTDFKVLIVLIYKGIEVYCETPDEARELLNHIADDARKELASAPQGTREPG